MREIRCDQFKLSSMLRRVHGGRWRIVCADHRSWMLGLGQSKLSELFKRVLPFPRSLLEDGSLLLYLQLLLIHLFSLLLRLCLAQQHLPAHSSKPPSVQLRLYFLKLHLFELLLRILPLRWLVQDSGSPVQNLQPS